MYLLYTKILDNFSTREPTLIRLVRFVVLVCLWGSFSRASFFVWGLDKKFEIDRINSWVRFQFSAFNNVYDVILFKFFKRCINIDIMYTVTLLNAPTLKLDYKMKSFYFK